MTRSIPGLEAADSASVVTCAPGYKRARFSARSRTWSQHRTSDQPGGSARARFWPIRPQPMIATRTVNPRAAPVRREQFGVAYICPFFPDPGDARRSRSTDPDGADELAGDSVAVR